MDDCYFHPIILKGNPEKESSSPVTGINRGM